MTDSRSRAGSGMRSRNKAAGTRPSVASKELAAARRKRRQRQVMRNRIIFGLCIAIALALLIFMLVKLLGAVLNSGRMPDNSTLTFTDSGKVIFEEVTELDTDTYSKTELKTYTKDLIASFNETYGEEAIVLDKLSVKGSQVYIKTTYKDAECYGSFTSYDTYNASYEQAISDGYEFDELYMQVVDGVIGQAASIDDTSVFAGQRVAIVDENITVIVPGTISYVSSANVTLDAADTITISQSDGNADATDLVYIIYTLE